MPSHHRPPGAHPTALGLALLCSAAGCYHGTNAHDDGAADGTGGTEASGGSDGGTADDTGAGACADGVSVAPLRRLSEAQYRNTLAELFAPAGIDVATDAATELDRIPLDDGDGSFGILDTRVSDLHARAYYRLADRLADIVAYDPDNLTAIGGACAGPTMPDASCIDAFLDDFGLRAYRRPLFEDERSSLHEIASTAPDGIEAWRSLVFMLLMSPQFLYHVELDGEGDDTQYQLDGYALASRLSFHFWQSMPDADLFAAAADGSILTEDGYLAQLDRVFEDPRTQRTVDRFYDEWLQLGWLTTFPTTPAFQTFAMGTSIGEPDADHLLAAQDEIHALQRHFTFEQDGSLADLLLTDVSLTDSPHLAQLYGVQPWDGAGEPPSMPAGQRAGLLTRVAFLLTGNEESHPVHRGAALRERILCEALPQPDPTQLPPGALDQPPVDGQKTTRQRYEEKTADAVCNGCHHAINPIGFVLEGYDAIGRYRTEETIIDSVSGEILATLPLDTAAAPAITGDDTVIADGVALSQQVVDSGKAEPCFAQQYFRATFGRTESDEDTCLIETVTTELTDNASIRSALRSIALAATFRTRRVM